MTEENTAPIDIDPVLLQALSEIACRSKRAARRTEINLKAILTSLATHTCSSVVVNYSGSGDSGLVEDIRPATQGTDDLTFLLEKSHVTVIKQEAQLVDGKWADRDISKSVTLYQALEDFAYDWLEANQPGWELNEGSDGYITFDLIRNKVTINHSSYFMESETSEVEL